LISDVFDTPELISSLAKYSEQLHETDDEFLGAHDTVPPPAAQSILFLRIQAAASYYSTNRTLMERPEPVDVDISTFCDQVVNPTTNARQFSIHSF
jgi:hypothetical protein